MWSEPVKPVPPTPKRPSVTVEDLRVDLALALDELERSERRWKKQASYDSQKAAQRLAILEDQNAKLAEELKTLKTGDKMIAIEEMDEMQKQIDYLQQRVVKQQKLDRLRNMVSRKKKTRTKKKKESSKKVPEKPAPAAAAAAETVVAGAYTGTTPAAPGVVKKEEPELPESVVEEPVPQESTPEEEVKKSEVQTPEEEK